MYKNIYKVNKENTTNIYRKKNNIVMYSLIAMLSFVLGWQATLNGLIGSFVNIDSESSNQIDFEKEHGVSLDLYWKIWEEIEERYADVDAIDKQKMIYGSIKGLVSSLNDPYTSFMTPEESEQFYSDLNGTLEGIGAELTIDDGVLTVVSPLRESPAEKAGVMPKDIIYMINDEVSTDMGLFEAIMKIRGEKGTEVKLTLLRKDVKTPIEITIVRDSINIDSVTVEKLDNDITYLSVNQFNEKTNTEFGAAISDILLNGSNGIIVDLRFNGGGYLPTAVDLVSYLLPANKKAVIVKERNKEDEVLYTHGGQKVLDVPLVVLVNGGSASASEIVVGAIKDHKRGVIMGTQTFGKGTVQEIESFSDESSMKMTIAKWYSPSDTNINKVGYEPDIIVEFTDEDIKNEVDVQKEAAIEYLLNQNYSTSEE